jgi:ferredoxin--NADP+ reductase
MVSEMKAKVIYTNLLKEDLVVIRILPDEGMPEYITGQFLTIGVIVPTENYKLVRRAYSIASHPENND